MEPWRLMKLSSAVLVIRNCQDLGPARPLSADEVHVIGGSQGSTSGRRMHSNVKAPSEPLNCLRAERRRWHRPVG